MMRWIVGASVRLRLLVVATAAAVIVVGTSQLRQMPVEVLPDFTPTTVEIQTEALGLSASEVEQLITVPLEQDLLNGVAFLDDIRSESVPGLSRILMIFEPGTDTFTARQVVAERLTQAHALPQVSKPPHMLQPLSSTDRVLLVGMSSDKVSPIDMGVLARWTIAPRLIGVPGVANVSVWGQEDRQLQVQVDPKRLRANGVGLDQVIETSANALWVSPLTFVEASTPGTGGFIDTPNQRLGIQHESPINTAADLAKVRLEGTGARKLLLGDVANVVEDHQPLIGDAVVNGAPGMLLVIQRFPDTNVREVTQNVEKALDEMKPGLQGITFDSSVYRPASYVDRSLDNLRLAAIIGLVLLALVLLALLFRWRSALVAIVAVPLSLITAALVLWAFGSTMNAVVVTGLAAALVLLVDEAVVSVEGTTRRLREQGGGTRASTTQAIIDATLDVRTPALYATVVIALAVAPLYFFDRLAGAFFPDLATAYLVALLAATVVALTVAPALTVLLASRSPGGGESPVVGRLERNYGTGLSHIVARPPVAYGALGAALVVGALTVPFLSQSLLPKLKESQLLVRWDGPAGTSLPEMNRITSAVSGELRSVPGVSGVGAHVGRAIAGDQVVGANSAELWVSIDPAADYDQTVAAVKRLVGGYPGLSEGVQTYSDERVNETLSGTSDDVVVRVYGEDLKILTQQAREVRSSIAGINGIENPRVLLPPEEPTLQVKVDLAKAEQFGIKPGDVRRAATTLLSGLVVGNLFERQKVFDVVVWGVPETRTSLTSVKQLLIDTPGGGQVPLGRVADVRIVPSPGIIKRQAVSRYVDVGASVSGRSRGDVVRDVNSQLANQRFPIEYHAEVLPAKTQDTWRLIGIALAVAVGIFLLLQVAFASWRLAILAVLTLPLAVVGSLLAILVSGGTVSFGSYMALLAVLGIAIRFCVLLFDRYRHLVEEGEAFGADLVQHGARDRLGATFTTTMATALLCIPVLILGSRPGLELVQPVAVAVIGGVTTSALLVLFVMPVLYLRFGFSRKAEHAEPEGAPSILEDLAPSGAAAAIPEGIPVTEAHAVPDPGSG